jgi:hypothetical protein
MVVICLSTLIVVYLKFFLLVSFILGVIFSRALATLSDTVLCYLKVCFYAEINFGVVSLSLLSVIVSTSLIVLGLLMRDLCLF